jgi:transposase
MIPLLLKAMIAELQAENARITATLRVHDQLVQASRLRIAKLQKLAFGKSSEKGEREIEQLELALEDLLVAVAEDDDAPIDEGHDEPVPEATDAPALRRRPRVSDETLRERHELDPGTCCLDCGGELRVTPKACDPMRAFGATGENVNELFDMIAAQMKVTQIARIKKSCRRCEKIVQEPAPSRPIPGSMAGPNLLVHVLVSKFEDHLPLYRQQEIFERMGRSHCHSDQWPINDDHSRKHARRLGRSGHENPVAADREDRGGHHGQRFAPCGRYPNPCAGPLKARQGAWQRG